MAQLSWMGIALITLAVVGLFLLFLGTSHHHICSNVYNIHDMQYPNMEQPLPNYTDYYYAKLQPMRARDLVVCTDKDIEVPNSDPRPTHGCRDNSNQKDKDITLFCQVPIVLDCVQTFAQVRELFYRHTNRVHLSCNRPRDIGDAQRDGKWSVCFSKSYKPKTNDCLIYSIGINNEWSFDDQMSKEYGCEVHSFDPTIGQKDHKRSEKIWFHNIGIAGEGERKQEAQEKGWKMMSLKEIITYLGHENRVIDILKVDIEYTEWDAFEEALQTASLSNVRQLVTELHIFIDEKKTYIRFNRILQALENAGFQRWFVGKKPCWITATDPETGQLHDYNFQIDMGFINTNFLL